ncbi:MAG: LysR family transcriptional regulator [Marivita sp.]|uniref:LysR substrate-binding domain-containing protein n=1 Tax=Marivita sp. TaxID=2003365 RepID=UPI001B0416B2|nr:LysR substrate-binding domain-containing protein [Marivita sp.]MBO6883451.1 LysR family transcriptional regulator [Marivita sp.]
MSDWLPSLNTLRAFEATARHLSFVKAAAELHVTPAAVKQLVRKLEETLGCSLIERAGRGLQLTVAGRAGLSEMTLGFDHLLEAVRRMRAVSGRRRLVVSVEPSFATAWLVPRLERFRRRMPDVDVLIDSSAHLVDLVRGDADIAIRFGAPADNRLVAKRLFDEELCAFCSPAIAAGLRAPSDLARCQFIHWETSSLGWASSTRALMDWTVWLDRIGAAGVVSEGGLRFSDYNLAVQAAIAGQGVVLGSRPVLADLVTAGLLVFAVPQRLRTHVGYDAVTTGTVLMRPEVTAFVDWILFEASGRADF